jgi:hypothetical protein
MSGGQIAALICAIALLFPGGCFLFFGVIAFAPLLLIAAIILGLAAWLFSFAFRGRSAEAAGPARSPGSDLATAHRRARPARTRDAQL